MTPAFGFSAGDFVSAIGRSYAEESWSAADASKKGLIKKVCKALKAAGGASTEYQHAIVELENLIITLSHLEALQPNEDNIHHVNAIRAMAMACKLPLQDFLAKISRYETSLSPFAARASLGSARRKAQWALSLAEETEKLRAWVAAKHISINLLLAMQTSRAISNLNVRVQRGQHDLVEEAAKHQSILQDVQKRLQQAENRSREVYEMHHAKLNTISSKVDTVQDSIMRFRSLGGQVVGYLSIFPFRIQGLLRAILQTNVQSYQILVQMKEGTLRNPAAHLESDIKFEDALGQIRYLPYEHFRYWEPFEGLLRAQFKDKPGEEKVFSSQYHIIDLATGGQVIRKEGWTSYVREGATLSMSMIMSHLRALPKTCPRCTSPIDHKSKDFEGLLICKRCQIRVFPFSNPVEDAFDRITLLEEEEEVRRKQLAEDLQLYGSRLEPVDAVDVDEDVEIAKLPPKRNAVEFEAAVGKGETQVSNHTAVTCMDWNSGRTPIESWLNQSAVPLAVPVSHTEAQDSIRGRNPTIQELQEIKVFRNIHIAKAEGQIDRINTELAEILSDLKPRAQIYFRNIADRYPLLPLYLTRRLAVANCVRAERLCQQSREQNKPSVASKASPKFPEDLRLKTLKRHGSEHTKEEPFACHECSRCFATRDLLLDHQAVSHFPKTLRIMPPPQKDLSHKTVRRRARVHMFSMASNPTQLPDVSTCSKVEPSHSPTSPPSDFWTGRTSSSRAASTHSRSSSRNSSLHGYENVDPKDQSLASWDTGCRKPSASLITTPANLPPPPVDLLPNLCFHCDVCGEDVEITRRRAWQTHVLADLRPYESIFAPRDHQARDAKPDAESINYND
ncbi:MAG: hypothetical protein Q9190_000932 [Brigantiaea leucoxantha]